MWCTPSDIRATKAASSARGGRAAWRRAGQRERKEGEGGGLCHFCGKEPRFQVISIGKRGNINTDGTAARFCFNAVVLGPGNCRATVPSSYFFHSHSVFVDMCPSSVRPSIESATFWLLLHQCLHCKAPPLIIGLYPLYRYRKTRREN